VTLDLRNLPGIISVLMCLAFAIWLWRIGARGSTARQLSVLLVIEGLTVLTSGAMQFGVVFPAPPPPLTTVEGLLGFTRVLLHHACDVALIALYPPFLATALLTRWTLFFSKLWVRITLIVFGVTLVAFVLPFGYEAYTHRVWVLYLAMCLTFVYALAVSVHALRVAATETQRRRARSFVIGFGIRDVIWGGFYGTLSYLYLTNPAALGNTTANWVLVYPIGTLVEVPLIAYGILSTQLFDIDLRLKWTIRQSTLAAIVIAIVYFATEAANRLFSNELGPWPGLVAAALIVFLLAPLQRVSERFANRLMPGTAATPEYLAHRKLQVYEAALTEALGGMGISDKERAILKRLRETLEVSPEDAHAMEDDLRRRFPSTTTAG